MERERGRSEKNAYAVIVICERVEEITVLIQRFVFEFEYTRALLVLVIIRFKLTIESHGREAHGIPTRLSDRVTGGQCQSD